MALDPAAIGDLLTRLSAVDRSHYPGDRFDRQPVHTCYVPAGAVEPNLVRQWGDQAATALPDPAELAELAGLSPGIAAVVHERVTNKLRTEPIEDLRFDFEDGYGNPGDEREDAHARNAAKVLAGWHAAGTAPPYAGLRVKSFDTTALAERAIRTLDLFCTTLLEHGRLPDGLLITFPKVTALAQVELFTDLLDLLEDRHGLPSGTLVFEIQVETPQSVVDADGRIALPGFIAAGRGRVRGLHFGTYDYTAALGLPSASQHLAHRACDFARHLMQVSTAGTGVWCSDGSTNILPIGTQEQIRFGWATHAALVLRSLEHGFYQGWDLHPHQLVTRYATVYGWYRQGVPAAEDRLAGYLGDRSGPVADEPATAQALATFLLRALRCGAYEPAEIGIPIERLEAVVRRHNV
jgi:citrate lyase beta subunit